MRVLLSAVLQPSHFFPLVPLAWALRAAGHEVRVAHQPRLTPFVQAAGLTSVVVGSDTQIDATLRRQAQASQTAGPRPGTGATRPSPAENAFHIRAALSLFADAAGRMADDLIEFGRHWKPDLIVFEWQCYGAHLAAEVLGIPSVRHQFSGPDFEVGIPGWRDMETESLRPLYSKHGLDEVRPDGLLTIDPCPPSLQFDLPATRTYLPMRYVPFNGSGQVQEWMFRRSGKPRIALTVGSSYLWMMGNLSPVRMFIDVLAELDVEIVAAVPQGGTHLVGEVGPDVRVAENVPLELFLPSCDLIIHHGGTGTVGTALTSGIPQIISPPSAMGDPPFHNAERIVAAGAGVQVDVHHDAPEQLRDAVRKVLETPSFLDGARGLVEENRARPLPAELVSRLEDLAGRNRD
ncbi:nucleotide disphospho-sugar-binding domain-containing protein [Nonomuraea aridisoli]|nr:nucleotide disphospho-sugar-binding domain-containing protein [Nonomuraea aridisoli]